jgi:signal transduction histidine kinase
MRVLYDKMLGDINQKQEEALRNGLRYCNDLLGMITSILEVRRMEAEDVKLQSQMVNLDDILDDLRSIYDVPLNKELSLIWDHPCKLPPIRTDSGKLRHILQNLINNAMKFTEKGNVTISTRCLPETRTVEFKVTDTGIGIPKEALPFIFEMFRQLDGSESRTHGGVGLGLYIVKKFTEMLGGKIDVESEPGKGSTFTVTIPYEKQAPALTLPLKTELSLKSARN